MSRKPKKYHYIYKTTCKVTGKFYVGMHSTDSLDDGYLGSGKILGYSRKKYGDQNHLREILEYCSSRDELKQREKEIVNESLLADPLNINLKYGGDGGQTSEVSSLMWKNNPQMRKDQSERIKHQWKNPKIREIYKQNCSEILRKAHAAGKIRYNVFLGKKHSDSTKQKMSVSHKGKHTGSANSQYGISRIGINKDGKIKKVLPEQLQMFLDSGWTKGFK